MPSFPERLRAALPDASIETLILDFLEGSGLPCPTLFSEVRGAFNTMADLSRIDTPNFRSQIFAWAVSGKPLNDPSITDMYKVQLLLPEENIHISDTT